MDNTEQVPEADETSIEDRLAAAFTAATEPPEEESAEPEAEPTGEDTPEGAAAEPDESEEVEFEGKAYKVPKELKPALLRQADYTQKTQEVATLRKQAEDRMAFAEAQQQLMAAAHAEAVEYSALKARKKEFDGLDWSALYGADPGQAFNLQAQARRLEEQIAEKERALNEKVRMQTAIREQHAAKQWGLAVEAARQRIGKLSQEEDVAMAKSAAALGFDEAELKSRFADARVLHAIYKAAKWDALQAAKPLAEKRAAEAKPMKQASRTGPQAQRDGALADARAKLRKTGKDVYAEQVLNAMFKE